MKKTIKIFFSLLLLGGVALTAEAQAPSLSLSGITGVDNTWYYGTVTCTSPRSITSITLSMINNEIDSYGNRTGAGINPITGGRFTSLGDNPRTVTYVFNGISASDVAKFIHGIDFTRNNNYSTENPYVRISVDSNPTNLPAGASITVWKDHPDGTPHYYLWVDKRGDYRWDEAYRDAKSYYFQGMRGYLPTITSAEEDQVLKNISAEGGWSAGIKTNDALAYDALTFSSPSNSGTDFRWACGPEAGFAYYRMTNPASNLGVLNNAFYGFSPLGEPNNYISAQNPGGEWCMQVNFMNIGNPTANGWNDLPIVGGTPVYVILSGYFIEFGGSGEAYSVGAANYPANAAYKKPTVATTNAQWYNYSPGNTSVAGSTLKPTTGMRSNVMVIE